MTLSLKTLSLKTLSLKTKFINGISNILKPTKLNILILLSLIIIIVLVYLKTHKIELFTSFMDNYINKQKIYKDIQSIMVTHEDNINDFGSRVQQVISGQKIGISPEPTTNKLIVFDTTLPTTTFPNTTMESNNNRQPTPTRPPNNNRQPTPTRPPITTRAPNNNRPPITTRAPTPNMPPTPTMAPITTTPIDCRVYPDTHVGLPNKCLTEIWQGVGCPNVDATNNYPDGGWWKKQNKADVKNDMFYWTINPNLNGHFNLCYGTDQSKWPSKATVGGNNGTANCSTYCAGRNGASWDNSLPSSWKGSVCAGTNDSKGCNSTNLTLRTGLTCDCKKDDGTPYNQTPAEVNTVYGNNGTVNCTTYCAGTGGKSWNNELPSNWNGAVCAGTNDPLGCNSTNLTLRQGLTCSCRRNDATPWR
jgi:hypothetical protein